MTDGGWLRQMRAMRRLCSIFATTGAAENISRIRNAGRSSRFAVLATAFLLAGCGGGPPVTFDLSAAHEFGSVANSRGALAIYEPSASLPVASQRIVMRTGVDTVAYLKDAQWADRLPALIQMRLIESFENAHSLRAVGRIGLVADYSLQTEIRRFEADVSHGVARVELSARIVGSNGAILTSGIFTAEAPAASDDATTVTAALNQALAKVLRDIVVWVTPKVKA
jgi:cholesterol transport system auxiliary component